MRKTHRRLWLWLLPVAWAALIFAASADSGSSARSSRLIGPLVRWLAPDISPAALDRTVYAVRKGAHMAEYAVLATLLWLALRHPGSRTEPWRVAWMLAVAYAITDELHQVLVPDRTGAVADVALDAVGAAVALLLMRWWRNRRSELCQARRVDTVRSL